MIFRHCVYRRSLAVVFLCEDLLLALDIPHSEVIYTTIYLLHYLDYYNPYILVIQRAGFQEKLSRLSTIA